MPYTTSFAFIANFPNGKVLVEVAFQREICIRFFIFTSFIFSLKVSVVFRLGPINVNMCVTFYFIFCGMTVFF